MMDNLYQISRQAGDVILKYYGDKAFSVKEDLSPVTVADQASHSFLVNALRQIKDIPILSEENIIPYEQRKLWNEFWLIDPLDGTKEFLNGIDEFCICIALIKDKQPVMGAIYAPALNEFYWAQKENGFHYKGPQREKRIKKGIIAVTSRFHTSVKTQQFLENSRVDSIVILGSSLKFGRIALGEIDLYPRFEGSKEWDIAAGHIIINEAGGHIIEFPNKKEPTYNKVTLENNHFLVNKNDCN